MRAFFTLLFLGLSSFHVYAAVPCGGTDQGCLLKELEQAAAQIEEPKWRDISYRELAKSLAASGRLDDAMTIVPKIDRGDTQALTIRGIGMAAAGLKLPAETYKDVFKSLATLADTIKDQPSKEIAYTYIAMSQSFAGQDKDAIATAKAMTNPSLRHKALGEIAEVQAERKDAALAQATLAEIDSQPYRSKASRTVTLLLADRGLYDEAARVASGIGNPTQKAEALQYIISKQQSITP